MQKIDDLQLEIKSFESEIANLQAELVAVGGRTLELSLGESDAETISKSVRLAAAQVVERQPVLRGLKDAIAELSSRLIQKQSQLEELEVVELKQSRKKRIEQGKSLLRAKFADVETAAQSLQNLYFNLKAIALEYEKDFAEINPPTSSGAVLNRNSLLNIEPLYLPHFVEEKDRFVLSNKFFDLFQQERRLIEQQRLDQSRLYRQDQERQWAEIKQKQAEEKLRTEREYRASLLSTKQLELKDFKSVRSERLSSLKTADVGRFDSAIAKLKEEIADLEKPMQP
jgi:tRNA U55 pseudouridine synthase TruB